MARPLRYAARNNFANLAVLRDLEGTLIELLGPLPHFGRLAACAPLIRGLDRATAPERAKRVRRLLEIIDGPEEEAEPSRVSRRESGSKPPAARVRAHRLLDSGALDASSGLGSIPMTELGGLSASTADKLAHAGIESVLDALLWLPRRYEDRRTIARIGSLAPGEFSVVRGQVLHAGLSRPGRGKPIFEVVVGDGTGTVTLRWFRFHLEAMKRRFGRGNEVTVGGTVTAWGPNRQMVHPEVEAKNPSGLRDTSVTRDTHGWGTVVPVYPEIEDVRAKQLRKVLQEVARRFAPEVIDPLPPNLLEKRKLPDLAEALKKAHLPETLEPGEDPDQAVRRRLVYDELFFFQLFLAERKQTVLATPGLSHPQKRPWRELAKEMLPFELTRAQGRVLEEIARDLAAERPMNRLLQGDVGSGKTAVAMVAAAIVAEAGRQTLILAPTEILAEQHAATGARFLSRLGLRSALLTGATRAKARRDVLEALRQGQLNVLIGTHALLEAGVEPADLGLVIVDEQHRFGVQQRAALRPKARRGRPDVLVMTATPIPRTLALSLYGDLEVSSIDERPPGRTPVKTKIVGERDRGEALRTVERALAEGRQAYVVFPLVESSEALDLRAATEAAGELRARYPSATVGLLHGRMRSEEKAAAMESFRSGATQILVSTTVIEVGVDVPNATVMVLEHAERFGLSQIHQLRGRVGRGQFPGECLLVVGGGSQDAWSKLAVLEKTDDGFRVAQADLELRGPGEMLGVRQSGLGMLALADLVRDAGLLELARADALAIFAEDPRLELPVHRALRSELQRRRRGAFALAEIG